MAASKNEDSKPKTAHELAKKQRDISVAEFFEKNRHLLGFDNKRKALLTAVKEAVDNSLDACEEARILPEITVEITQISEDRFNVVVEDNGPGILPKQIPKIFAKLLYGSKFHKLSQSRGQQGIGISATVLYGQLTTGKPAKIISRIGAKDEAHYCELEIDTKTNQPEILKDERIEWHKERGTRVEVSIEASYQKGPQSVDEYLKQTAIVNPHVTIIYTTPKAEQIIFPRATESLPKEAIEIKPHPYGVEIGRLMDMLDDTQAKTLQSFLTEEFSRVGPGTAKEICQNSGLLPSMKPQAVDRIHVEKLIEGIKKTKIISPPIDCISPIGEELLEKGLKKEIKAEFYASVTRSASVYRGNPFVIEAGIAWGGELPADGSVQILRFANRVPLLYQQGACAITESIEKTNWKPYGLQQSGSNLPQGPAIIMVHMASVWVPFTSEAKEALAHYPEIMDEVKLALQEAGRKLGQYVNKKKRIGQQLERASLFENYIPEIADSIAYLSGKNKDALTQKLKAMTQKEEIQKVIGTMAPDDSEEDENFKMEMKTGEEEE
ncbi:MAG TPA: DNA topoisomerase VI subunit B [Candidatus Nanoarchaeia archaeon]|nr:DNA topoisomerase VI subunit B [Candidatus Nanoarchaeia archaeon]